MDEKTGGMTEQEKRRKTRGGVGAALVALSVAIWKAASPSRFSFWGWLGVTLGVGTAAYNLGYYIAQATEGEEDDKADDKQGGGALDGTSLVG